VITIVTVLKVLACSHIFYWPMNDNRA